jgi:hypothetical protein
MSYNNRQQLNGDKPGKNSYERSKRRKLRVKELPKE